MPDSRQSYTVIGGDQINVGGSNNIGKQVFGLEPVDIDKAILTRLIRGLRAIEQDFADPDQGREIAKALVVLERQSRDVSHQDLDFSSTLNKVKDVLANVGQGAAGSAVAAALLQLVGRF